jgi:hypothetical protein
MKTKAEKEHMNRVAELGWMSGHQPAGTHHLRTGMGMAQRNTNFNVIPLCPLHHRTGGYGTAIHAGIKAFEKNFGTESQLLERVNKLL